MGNDSIPTNDSITSVILDEPADHVRLFKKDGIQYQELVGNVRMRHDSTFFRCDSAILDENNQVEAYGHVVIQELDSTYIFADTLLYNGNTRLAHLKGDVVLENGLQKLFSDQLDYQLDTRVARYNKKSYMTDGGTQLSSEKLVFYVPEHQAIFYDSVIVVNDTFNLKADSMGFNTRDYRVDFLSPTVLYNDTSRLYAEQGYYLMKEDEALFHQNAQFESGKTMGSGDSIFYYGQAKEYEIRGKAYISKEDKKARAHRIVYDEEKGQLNLYGNARVTGDDIQAQGEELIYSTVTNSVNAVGRSKIQRPEFNLTSDLLKYSDEEKYGRAKGNVIWEDSSGLKRIFTDSLEYTDKDQYARAIGIEQRPLFQWIGDSGDTMYMISDTLITSQSVDEKLVDSTETVVRDTFQNFKAYYDVAILRDGVRGRADSIAFNEKDSLITLFGNPVMWMDTTQLYGDTIFITMEGGEIDKVLIKGNAFVITSPDSIYFNQITGRTIIADFLDGELVYTEVVGNAESIYFILDEELAYIGMNKIICSRIEMTFEESNVVGISFLENTNGELFEMKSVSDENSFLKGYSDKNILRPLSIEMERKMDVNPLSAIVLDPSDN
ncbi:hypothetical protein GCM10025777_17000 [Membranihabitans marinus]